MIVGQAGVLSSAQPAALPDASRPVARSVVSQSSDAGQIRSRAGYLGTLSSISPGSLAAAYGVMRSASASPLASQASLDALSLIERVRSGDVALALAPAAVRSGVGIPGALNAYEEIISLKIDR
ncbi:hypothetical protein [Aquamicrobium sp. LC103]|uniref:hypothetical protein n=1 Tax=Aquamicrobium sp. LC103 TaxID=1120658 RepID=UPI00063E8919|nr:hypothetical protein [Aquamicrobium sp. LC103]TKT76885.1 hypothetical protein XW59_015610 [Aquamicrobium sp. LC103]